MTSRDSSVSRVCDLCGNPVVLGPTGYTHRDGPDKHSPVPVRHQDSGNPIFGHVSRGHKRPSGDAALFTQGDGRGRRW
jgi:hypothetical protein